MPQKLEEGYEARNLHFIMKKLNNFLSSLGPILEGSLPEAAGVNLMSMDFQNAFDKMDHGVLWHKHKVLETVQRLVVDKQKFCGDITKCSPFID